MFSLLEMIINNECIHLSSKNRLVNILRNIGNIGIPCIYEFYVEGANSIGSDILGAN